jgi:hypothetical protein
MFQCEGCVLIKILVASVLHLSARDHVHADGDAVLQVESSRKFPENSRDTGIPISIDFSRIPEKRQGSSKFEAPTFFRSRIGTPFLNQHSKIRKSVISSSVWPLTLAALASLS